MLILDSEFYELKLPLSTHCKESVSEGFQISYLWGMIPWKYKITMIKDEKQTNFLKIYLHMNLINYETVKYIYTMKKGKKYFFEYLLV